ncbi:MAG: dihydropteroate synthase [Promethearchaeota archaeon]
MVHDEINVKINEIGVGDNYPARLMGVLNLSEESFYKNSVVDEKSIISQATAMIDAGATFLDIGGRSTAPWSAPISVEEEVKRISWALKALLPVVGDGNVLISLDTQYSVVAKAAHKLFVDEGFDRGFILNDVSGFNTDPNLVEWLVKVNLPVIIMASHGVPGDSLGIEETLFDLRASIDKLIGAGYPKSGAIIIDPAIGRWVDGKVPAIDMDIIKNLPSFRQLGYPLLIAISRKSFIGAILNEEDPENRLDGTLSATAIAVFLGAHVVRTHDVTKQTSDVVRVAESIRKSGQGTW